MHCSTTWLGPGLHTLHTQHTDQSCDLMAYIKIDFSAHQANQMMVCDYYLDISDTVMINEV